MAIERQTCIRFVRHTAEENFVDIVNGSGCSSFVGRIGGSQALSLARPGCVREGIIIHEALHALGLAHMHSHENRDQYVRVLTENIDPDRMHNFNIVNPLLFSNFGTPYDFLSVMHYGPRAFSTNGEDTIQTLDPAFQDQIGQREGLSAGDVQRLNAMYPMRCRN